jgi:hypothetical protein
MENIEKLTNLEELWLGKNKIRKLECLDTFSKLKILSIQSNRITKMEGLEGLVNLEELYLSHNGLKKIEGLEKNVSASAREAMWKASSRMSPVGCGASNRPSPYHAELLTYRRSCAHWTLATTRSSRSRVCRISPTWRSSG